MKTIRQIRESNQFVSEVNNEVASFVIENGRKPSLIVVNNYIRQNFLDDGKVSKVCGLEVAYSRTYENKPKFKLY